MLKLLPSPEVNNRTSPSKHNWTTKPVSLPRGSLLHAVAQRPFLGCLAIVDMTCLAYVAVLGHVSRSLALPCGHFCCCTSDADRIKPPPTLSDGIICLRPESKDGANFGSVKNYLRNFEAIMSKLAPSRPKEAGSGIGRAERSIVRLSLPRPPPTSKITYCSVTE